MNILRHWRRVWAETPDAAAYDVATAPVVRDLGELATELGPDPAFVRDLEAQLRVTATARRASGDGRGCVRTGKTGDAEGYGGQP